MSVIVFPEEEVKGKTLHRAKGPGQVSRPPRVPYLMADCHGVRC